MELKIQDLCKSYGKKKALWNFTTEFENGIYGILGPNGAGKSTLMNILTDNLLRDSGSVLYDGEEILNLGASYREIMGYMPQQQQLYDTFTVTHFISYMGTLKGMKSRDIQGRMDELLPLLNLQKVRKKKLKEYIRGWVGYYHLASMKRLLLGTDEWLRRRIRMCIWKAWKKVKTKVANLIRCGINKYKAYEWGNTRKGYWRIANSYILHRAITNEHLCRAGYATLMGAYLEWHPK